MENNYLISVIVPVHNTVNYLRKCIESIRNQSLENIEIILVDNLSTDGSSEVCDEYASMDTRVKVIHLSVANASVARNAGIDMASAPYIGFIDSDDYIDVNMYEELLASITSYGVDLVYSNFQIEHDDGVYDMMCDRLNSSCCTKLFKKTLFSSLKFPIHNMYEDRLILHQWILESEKVVWIDKAFYHYVKRSSSICHVISPLQRYHFFLAQFCRLEFINNNLLFDTKEQYNMKTSLVKSCLRTFKEMRAFPFSESRAYVVDKNNLKKLIPLSKKELDIKCYKRLRKIVYFWPIYYWVHFKLKKINSGE